MVGSPTLAKKQTECDSLLPRFPSEPGTFFVRRRASAASFSARRGAPSPWSAAAFPSAADACHEAPPNAAGFLPASAPLMAERDGKGGRLRPLFLFHFVYFYKIIRFVFLLPSFSSPNNSYLYHFFLLYHLYPSSPPKNAAARPERQRFFLFPVLPLNHRRHRFSGVPRLPAPGRGAEPG